MLAKKYRETNEKLETDEENPQAEWDPNSACVYLRLLPPDISRKDLIDLITKNCSGFQWVSMGEPYKKGSKFLRQAWAYFET